MNTVSLPAETASVNWTVKPDLRTKRQQWEAGYRAFAEGLGTDGLTTDYERRGWNAALDACAYAVTNAYLVGARKS